MSGRFVLASGQIEPYDPVRPQHSKRIHALWGNVDASLARSRCYEENFLGFDEVAQGTIYALELGHRYILNPRSRSFFIIASQARAAKGDAHSHLSLIAPGCY